MSYERNQSSERRTDGDKNNGSIVLHEMIHTVCFHHVSFSYEKNTEVLRNISFQIDKPGFILSPGRMEQEKQLF